MHAFIENSYIYFEKKKLYVTRREGREGGQTSKVEKEVESHGRVERQVREGGRGRFPLDRYFQNTSLQSPYV